MMKFRQFIIEANFQFKNSRDPHIEDAMESRKKIISNRRASFGDCDYVSSHLAQKLKDKYPSAQTSQVGFRGQHSYVAIPEIDKIIDPTYDQFGGKTKVFVGKLSDGHPKATHPEHFEYFKKEINVSK